MARLKVYKASAGSGKTYKLTLEYLKICIKNADSYKNILAVTFTNKAAGEMKERIIGELFSLATGKKSKYLPDLLKSLKSGEEKIRSTAKTVLQKILHNYSWFSVTTIDSFFQRIIQSFVREVGLNSIYSLELDEKKVLNHAIDALLFQLEDDPKLKKWLIRFIETRIEEGKNWNFKRDMFTLAQEIFKEDFKVFEKEVVEKIQDKSLLDQYIKRLSIEKKQFEQFFVDAGFEALNIMQQHQLEPDDFAYGKSGVGGAFEKCSRGIILEPKSRIRSALDDVANWYSNKSQRIPDIENAFHAGLNRILEKCILHYEKHIQSYNTSKAILQNIYTMGLISDISERLRQYTHDQSLFLISDTNDFIQAIIDNNETPFIYEKTGNHFQYYMIDEFQDTSGMQWNNFKPLIMNSIAEGHECMVVGDVKQAIYRWRNSSWKILASEINNEFESHNLSVEALKYNWRSRKNVINFNNAFFNEATEILQAHLDAQISSFSKQRNPETIKEAYGELVQQVPQDGAEGGQISFQFIEADDKNTYLKGLADELPSLLIKLQKAGYALSEIAFLVRSKSEGKKIAEILMNCEETFAEDSKLRFDFISNDTLVIGASFTVSFITAILRYLVNNSDPVNLGYLLYEYMINIQKKNISLNDIFLSIKNNRNQIISDCLGEDFLSESILWKNLPVSEGVEQIIRFFGLNSRREDYPYLQAFQDLVHSFSLEKTGNIKLFIEWWDEFGKQETLSIEEKQDAINIITIHKSKGLQFKVVITPYCSWKIEDSGRFASLLWCKPDKKPYNELGAFPVKYSQTLGETIFYETYIEEKTEQFVDNLNLLYVAFTRAIDALFVFCPKADPSKINTVSDLACRVISAGTSLNWTTRIKNSEAAGCDIKEFTIGELPEHTPEIETENRIELSAYPTATFRGKYSISRFSEDFFSPEDESILARINYGKMMHEILSFIKTTTDVRKAINTMVFEGKLTDGEGKLLESKIKEYFNQEHAKEWFDPSWKVLNETEILSGEGDIYRPDRVLLRNNQVVVIDYKFTLNTQKTHQEQLKDYMKLIIQMGYPNITGYIWYPDLNKIVQVK